MGEHGIDPGRRMGDHGLDERALCVPRAEEPEVDDEQQPASAAKSQGGENQSDQQRELQGGNHGHAGVVVCLDETADLICQGGGFGGGRSAGGRGWTCIRGGLESRDQVRAGVCGDVEEGVDGEGEQGEEQLARAQPDKGHS